LNSASNSDKLWCLALFSGRRPKRLISTGYLREWACEVTNLPTWLLEETYSVIGDLAETISLLTPEKNRFSEKSLTEWISELRQLEKQNIEEKASICRGCMVNAKQKRMFCF
jgi:DNA ligase-1